MNRQGRSIIARSYAEALFRAATKAEAPPPGAKSVRDRVQEDCRGLATVLQRSNHLVLFLGNPQVSTEKKLALLEKTLASRIHPLLLRTIVLMVRRERMHFLGEMFGLFQEMVEHAQGIYQADLVSAAALGPEEKDQLKKALEKRTGHQLEIDFQVDPALIGGVVFQFGDTLIDGSIRTGLEKLRRRLHNATA